ncbi:MAG: tol-pal system protein YbgF [SAR324 cluster bacterium]|nr:tol-pal system protein YbgF [SAR324 cluster bacterium]
MRFQIIIITLIIIYSTGCTLMDRIEKKLGTQKEEPSVAQTQPAVRERARANPTPTTSSKNYERLKDAYLQQQRQIQELQEQLQNSNTTLRQLETKLMTNFELMERSVADSLNNMDQQIQQLTTAQNNSQPAPSQQKYSRQTPPQDSTVSNQKTVATGQTSSPLIENYSLLNPRKQKESARSTITRQNKNIPQTIRPLPPPPQEQVIDESKPVSSQKRAALLPNKTTPTFQDPSLNEPMAPYKLKSRPEVKKLYDQGMGAMINRKYPEAVQIFEDMLQQFPDDEYSDNAQFWLGHIHYSLNRMDQAQAAFQKVLQNYEHRPTSQGYKTPDAIYMLGKIAESRNDPEKARYYLEQVIARFPNSTAASNSEENLKVLQNRQ